MTLNKALKTLCITLLVLAVCLAPFSVCALSLDRTGSITLTTRERESKQIVPGATFRLYPVATAAPHGKSYTLTYTKDFENNGMDLPTKNLSDEYFAVHLMVYAKHHNLPYTEKTSDDKGKVTFSDLPCGAYLIVPSAISEGYLKANPFLITIPDKMDGQWVYDRDATPKVELDIDTPEKITISVNKRWKGTNQPPKSIRVSLVMDGDPVETVSLNAANDWSYTWENLDSHHAWFVTEPEVPQDYKVSYSPSQHSVTITNTTTPTEEEPPLEQTGQLNWPIPILMITGLVLFSLGWALWRFGRNDEECV